MNCENVKYSVESSSSEEISFKLLEGETMDSHMTNFIGIHFLSEVVKGENETEEVV